MTRVKTFIMGIGDTSSDPFEKLDEDVAGLGDVSIIEIVDILIPKGFFDTGAYSDPHIARRVIYAEKERG